MFFRILAKKEVPKLIRGLQDTREVVGPKAQGDDVVFGVIDDPSEVVLAYTSTLLPPKKYFTDARESLMRYNTRNGGVEETLPEVTPRVIFGMHACDINAQLRLDKVLLGDYVDPYYQARREATVIIGISCVPDSTCLCNAFGTGEVHEGFDLFLDDLGDRYFVTCATVEGAKILDNLVETSDATAKDTAAYQAKLKEFEAALQPAPDVSELPVLFDAKYDDTLWHEIGDSCLSCGACSMVCPTCYCFDIKDLQDADGVTGIRQRSWDSCNFSRFAEVAGGHNFRAERSSRVRYRFYHKFWAYRSKFGESLCVGCGRCNSACKVNINPRRVIEALSKGGE